MTTDPSYLKTHKIHVHNPELRKKYPCDKCAYVATKLGVLKRHKKNIHEKVKQFPCAKCSYIAGSRADLNRHAKVEHVQSSKPPRQGEDRIPKYNNTGTAVACKQCQYVAPSPHHLQMHLLLSSTHIKYQCDVCIFVAETEMGLNLHRVKRNHNAAGALVVQNGLGDSSIVKQERIYPD